jgi:parallel beta-helix repeat protein
MMDRSSTGNVISDNRVIANEGWGIALSRSSANVIRNNVIQRNLVGIEIYGTSSTGAVVRSNSLFGNEVGTQGLSQSAVSLNTITGPASHVRLWLIVPLWSVVIVLLAVAIVLRAFERRRRGPPILQSAPKVLAV